MTDEPDGCRGNGIPLPEIQKAEPVGGAVWREGTLHGRCRKESPAEGCKGGTALLGKSRKGGFLSGRGWVKRHGFRHLPGDLTYVSEADRSWEQDQLLLAAPVCWHLE